MSIPKPPHRIDATEPNPRAEQDRLDQVFFALSDPLRRQLLQRLDGSPLLVSELAAPFDISLQAVSRHIQVLVRAGLIQQARSGRISQCSLDASPLLDAAVWMNRYSKYWQNQFDVLAATPADDLRNDARVETKTATKRDTQAAKRTSRKTEAAPREKR